MLEYIMWGLIGTIYGTIIGIVPIAGVTTALITVFSLGSYFMSDPYLGFTFLMAIVASCAAADSYTSILTGIPGASTTAACVIDGYPMAQQGKAAQAMGIAISDSLFNGLFWTAITFATIPYFGQILLYLGTPEFAAFMILSMTCVAFVASNSITKSVIAILIGLFVGLIGQNPTNGIERFTFGWLYLEAGIGMVPLMSGLFGIPELIFGYKETRNGGKIYQSPHYFRELAKGFKITWKYKWDVFRGGLIGFVTGLLPGVGGAIGDFLAYGATKRAHPYARFGIGNPLGLAGCEGANSAQKVSSMIPTILFGIPAAPFAAMVMAIAMYFGIELGSPFLLYDQDFFSSMAYGYYIGTIGVALISIFLYKYITKLLDVPYWIYASIILTIVVWANMQYTGGWEDLALLIILSIIGITLRYFNISRPAVLVIFVVAERAEVYLTQSFQLYELSQILQRPVVIICLIFSIGILLNVLKKS